jgi:hypothetical protein
MLNKSIYIAILNEGTIRTELSVVLNELLLQDKYKVLIRYPNDKPITFNRNEIVKSFLKSPCDYLLMIDDDVVPPLGILNLADFQKDIIGALCFAFTHNMVVPIAWNRRADGQYWLSDLDGNDGLQKVDAVGTGCIMISRKVLENPWWQNNGGWFKNEYDKTGHKKEGNDLAFCRKAEDLGYKVYTHTDYTCSHIVPMDLRYIYGTLINKDKSK